jgi:hypothetical protein
MAETFKVGDIVRWVEGDIVRWGEGDSCPQTYVWGQVTHITDARSIRVRPLAAGSKHVTFRLSRGTCKCSLVPAYDIALRGWERLRPKGDIVNVDIGQTFTDLVFVSGRLSDERITNTIRELEAVREWMSQKPCRDPGDNDLKRG